MSCGSGPMNFSMVANNDIIIRLYAYRLSDGQKQNLTGYTIKLQVFNDSGVVITKSTNSGTITIPDQSIADNLGAFDTSFAAADTTNLAGDYIYEPVLVSPSGKALTGTNGDIPYLTPGQIYIRKENTVQ